MVETGSVAREYWSYLKRIWGGSDFRGVERLVAAVLHLIWPLFASFWVDFFTGRRRVEAIDAYVIVCLALTIWAWLCPTQLFVWMCSYFSVSSVVALSQVIFLTKVYGDIASPERSLILFMCNVAQMLFLFAAWYEIKLNLTSDEALFQSFLVLATIGYPLNAPKILVELQVTTNLFLLAVFLSHLVGRVGVVGAKR